ncbi:hypothetical protein OG709_00685 [Streptomyces sp. NBC_01267]|uniref:hypothetical protein n=1 Tax=unclassified Streptomyces TaxID=2593676 RepID=UPI002E2F2D93|nr:hypothetical protein [Streptomyces sp. NBC_01267]WSV58329.1 hypothetical protein OG282_34215 [Streptomyces sp. NBC_01014]
MADVAALLGQHSEQLRSVRPLAVDSGRHYHLRITDIARLETGSAEDWDRWRQAAEDLLAFNVQQAHEWLRILQQEKYDPAQDISISRLGDRVYADDITWYATVQ